MSTAVVDAHVHVFERADRVARGVDELVPVDRTASVDALGARLRAAGVDGAVLVPLDRHDEPVRRALATSPWAVAAVAVAGEAEQGRAGVDPVQALERRWEGFPFRALRTTWLGDPGRPLEDSPMLPTLRWLARRGLALWSYLPPEQAPLLEPLGALVPDLAVVLNHLGFAPSGMWVDAHGRPRFDGALAPAEVERVEGLARHPRTHLMFSGHYALSAQDHPYPDLAETSQRLVAAFGADRTLWASDWPWVDAVPGYTATLDVLEACLPGITPGERADILGGTVTRLLT
ncbi:amidohydrolase family protein [Phycicoccus endophyticus]|uniref:Amidohydrolase family protein n=1 Tax=Phycicoccus endophyticus TaxID=1690220 RepID=A0A7G9R213_9MICO|nr:amidohydrolase family protein [Phycicoccus endophyticus]NHI19727.1 amidohydrolase family protein [Phycicoccus endophyticus]QNN49638.1 amidohydrolase family protein [Phycicoccus endophyticus]GGL33534.1 hypothetical protein GCM10012283_15010 [Phycicoccus endophyticus]